MTNAEFKGILTAIFDRYAVAFEVDGCYSPQNYVQEVIELFAKEGYGKLVIKEESFKSPTIFGAFMKPTKVKHKVFEPIKIEDFKEVK